MIKVMEGLRTIRRYSDAEEALAHFYAKGHSLLSSTPIDVIHQGDVPNSYWDIATYFNGDIV